MRLSAIPLFGLLLCGALTTPYAAHAINVQTENGFYMIDDPLRHPLAEDPESSSFLAQGGYRFNPNIRIEGDLSFHHNDYRNQAPVTAGSAFNGDTEGFGVMTNAWYDFANKTGVTPFVGGGIGFNRGSLNTSASSTAAASADIESQTDTVMSWQAGGGAFYKLTKKISLTADYRITNTAQFAFNRGGTGIPGDDNADHTSHEMRVGATYRF